MYNIYQGLVPNNRCLKKNENENHSECQICDVTQTETSKKGNLKREGYAKERTDNFFLELCYE